MKMKSKKLLSTLLATIMVFGLCAAMPMTASAANNNVTIAQGETASEIQIKIKDMLATLSSGDIVTVTGSCTDATETVNLWIDSGMTVIWKAIYSGSNSGPMFELYDNGIFEVAAGGSVINNGTGNAIHTAVTTPTICISGGTVSSVSGITIDGSGMVIIDGGTVTSDTNTVISTESDIKINGGAIHPVMSATEEPTIHAKGGNVQVSYGIISAGKGYGILAEGTNANIVLNGGDVMAYNGVGIGVAGSGATISINGGRVRAQSGTAIGAYGDNCSIEINSGSVSDIIDGIAIAVMGKNSAVKVSGGEVNATKNAAISVTGEGSTVTVIGGFVFAYGTAITGEGNVIDMANGGTPAMSGEAVVCAWNKVEPAYSEGSPADLIVAPSGASATWEKSSYQNGIKYTNGANTGYFVVGGVTINADSKANSMSNFAKLKEYTSGLFTDVDENAWYGFNNGKVVARAYEYGMMEGDSAATFNPAGNITVAEAITVAARVHSIYTLGFAVSAVGGASNPWYKAFVDYSIDNGIIKSGDFTDYARAATRAEMAYIFAHALPDACYSYRWYINTPPDVTSSTPYSSEINKLYNSGIVGGSDDLGTFYPENNITRAETAAIIARLILPDTRLGTPPMPS